MTKIPEEVSVTDTELGELRARLEAAEADARHLRTKLGQEGPELARLRENANRPGCVGCMEREHQRERWAETSRQNGVKYEGAKQRWYEQQDRAEAAEQEVARLRAGESERPAAEGVQLTPAEWVHRWNQATADERLEAAARIMDGAVAARRCELADHAAELEQLRAQVARSQERFEFAMSDGDEQMLQRIELHSQVRALTERAEKAEREVARVRALHSESPHRPGYCYCANPCPCRTIQALDGEDL
jgi:chromosome segregation ATPase